MLIGGGYLFFNAIVVTHHFRWGQAIFNMGGVPITSGYVLIPFVFGIAIIFFNAKNPLGWVLACGSLIMLGFGVITSLDFQMQRMSAFQLISILVLFVGGIGLFVSSLKDAKH